MNMRQRRRPYRQSWRGGIPPTEQHIRAGREGFIRRGVFEDIENLSHEAGLHPVFMGPRDPDALTVPRCYLFFTPEAYARGDEWVACVDGAAIRYRVLIRPFGKGANRIDVLPRRHFRWFSPVTDGDGWRCLIVQSDEDRARAVGALQDLRTEYEAVFDV